MCRRRFIRNILMINGLMLLLFVTIICQEKSGNFTKEKKATKSSVFCPENPDGLYNRQATLEQISIMLNNSIPEFKAMWDQGFFVKDEMPRRFDISDLTDTSNKTSVKDNSCINFINNHIYHVFPNDLSYSFSHIIILEDGNLKVFKSINCKDRADSLKNVLDYLNKKLADDAKKDEIIDRVKKYREHGSYRRFDPMAVLKCQESTN